MQTPETTTPDGEGRVRAAAWTALLFWGIQSVAAGVLLILSMSGTPTPYDILGYAAGLSVGLGACALAVGVLRGRARRVLWLSLLTALGVVGVLLELRKLGQPSFGPAFGLEIAVVFLLANGMIAALRANAVSKQEAANSIANKRSINRASSGEALHLGTLIPALGYRNWEQVLAATLLAAEYNGMEISEAYQQIRLIRPQLPQSVGEFLNLHRETLDRYLPSE